MASRNGKQDNLLDGYNSDEWTQIKQTKKKNNKKTRNAFGISPLTRRRSECDMTLAYDATNVQNDSNYTNQSDNKNKIGYITEPGSGATGGMNNDMMSASEISDFFITSKQQPQNGKSQLLQFKNRTAVYNTDHGHYYSYNTKNNKDTKDKKDINYIGIGHDSNLQTDSETNAINKNDNISCIKNIGLTIEKFKETLSLQPERLHLTFHGEYDETNDKSIVKFDCIPILPQLLTSDKTFLFKNRTRKYYRDYMAAIARLFEEELIRFVSQPINQMTNEPLQTGSKYTCIGTEGIFDKRPKLRHLLQNIAERRFQCPYVHYRNRKFIAIYYGHWRQDTTDPNKSYLMQPPNLWLLPEYKLSSICRNRQIDAIVRLIEKRYDRIAANNPTLMNINETCQLYSWSIMNHAINQVIPNEVWQWLNSNESNETNININNGELYHALNRTFEITVSPLPREKNSNGRGNAKKLKQKQTKTEQDILEQRIRSILVEIYKNIKQDEISSNGLEFVSPGLPAPLLNYKILRFSNDHSITSVRTKIIAKIQRKYRNDFEIRFNKLSSASNPSYCLCGYVPISVMKPYVLDMKDGNDEISSIIKTKLVSRQECKIKLLLLLGCHSYKLAQIFAPFVECIVCVHPQTEIDDNVCVKFSKYFYNELAEIDGNKNNKNKFKYIVMNAFENALSKLRKSYGKNTACQFHENNMEQNVDKSIPTLMVVRIDRDKQNELMQYVNHRLMNEMNNNLKKKNNFGKSSKKHCTTNNMCDVAEIENINNPSGLVKRSSRGGHPVDYAQICDFDNNHNNRRSLSIESVSLPQSLDPTVDEYDGTAMVDIESCNYGVSWEYMEAKGNINFSYSLIKCNSTQIKQRVEQILKDKKHQETVAMNRKLTSNKNNTPKKPSFLTETEDDVNYVDLRWDVTDLPKCQCTMSIPHRVEDELILLINGKHIDRNIKLPMNEAYTRHKRAASIPNGVGVGGYNINVTDIKIDDTETCVSSNECKHQSDLSDSTQSRPNIDILDIESTSLDVNENENEYSCNSCHMNAFADDKLSDILTDLDEKDEMIAFDNMKIKKVRSRGGGNGGNGGNNKQKQKVNVFYEEKEEEQKQVGGNIVMARNVKKSYDPSPLYRAKYNIKIEREFSKEIVNSIQEDIKQNEMYGYMDKMTGIICNNNMIINNGNVQVMNYNFHQKNTNEELYCVAMKNESGNNNSNNNNKPSQNGYTWTMVNKLYTKKEIEEVYKINEENLPKPACFTTDLSHENTIRDTLTNTKEVQKIINSTQWHKIPKYSRNYNKKRLILCLDKPEFIKNMRNYNILSNKNNKNNKKEINLIPIVMFDYNNKIYVEFVWIVKIDNNTNIGVSFYYNKNKNDIIVTGIHLDKKYIYAQYQLISTQNSCHILNAFNSNITHLKIGNPDDDVNRIKDLKHQVIELKKMNKEQNINIKQLKTQLKAIVNNPNNQIQYETSDSFSLSAITPSAPSINEQQIINKTCNNKSITPSNAVYIPYTTPNGEIVLVSNNNNNNNNIVQNT